MIERQKKSVTRKITSYLWLFVVLIFSIQSTVWAEIATAKDEQEVDEAIQSLSSTQRKGEELDLVNNISVPHEQEMAPDIDEEIQTL